MEKKTILDKIDSVLIEKTEKSGLILSDLEKYYSPVNDSHIKHLAATFGISEKDLSIDQNLWFARFVYSVFNSGYTNYMKTSEKRYELASILHHFDFKKYPEIRHLVKDLIKENAILGTIKDNVRNRIHSSIDSIYYYLNINYEYLKNIPKTNTLSKKEYIDLVEKTIKTNSRESKILGMNTALFSDALKECGIIDIAKPDVHIIDFLNAVDPKNFPPKTTLSLKQIRRTNEFFYDFSRATNQSIYQLDKKIWLVCSKGYSFYLDNNRDYKQQLLSSIRETK